MPFVKFSDHILEGDHASRPAPDAVPVAALYSCDDHDTIYRSNGVDAWTDWIVAVAPDPVAGIPETLIDAKGDLIVGSADDTADRLAVGSNGHVLTADSGEALGVKWAAAAGGGGGDVPAERAWLVDNYHPDDYPASPNATYDDEFNDAAGMSGAGNGLNARWAWRNQGTATATFGKAGWLTLTCPQQSSNNLRIIEIAAFADGTYDAKVSFEGAQVNWAHGGIVLVDATNGDMYAWELMTVGAPLRLELNRWTSVTAFGSTVVSLQPSPVGPALYLRVVKSGTSLAFWYSRDGVGWIRTTVQTDAVDATRIGLMVGEGNNTGTSKLHCDYFRKVA